MYLGIENLVRPIFDCEDMKQKPIVRPIYFSQGFVPKGTTVGPILHTFQSVYPTHGQWPAFICSWRVFYFHPIFFVYQPLVFRFIEL